MYPFIQSVGIWAASKVLTLVKNVAQNTYTQVLPACLYFS